MEGHIHNYTPCHFPNVDGQIDPFFRVVFIGFHCMLCGQFHYVGVWSMFKRLAYGIFYTTFGQDISWKMVLPLMHFMNLTYSYSYVIKIMFFFSKVIHVWLKIWRIIFKQLTMGFIFAPSLKVSCTLNQDVYS